MERLFYALVPDNKQNRKKNLFRNKRGECLFVFFFAIVFCGFRVFGERQRVKIYLKLQIKKSKETKRMIRVI